MVHLNVAEPSTVSPPDRRRIGPAPTRPSLESHNKLGPAPISRRAWLYPKSFKCIEVLQMLVCPYDCHWCDLPDCRSGGCRLASESALIPCAECGVLIVASSSM